LEVDAQQREHGKPCRCLPLARRAHQAVQRAGRFQARRKHLSAGGGRKTKKREEEGKENTHFGSKQERP
jgi:hypothetical protein